MSLYSNLNDSSQSIPQPIEIGIELMEHQKRALYAMIELEKLGEIKANDILFFENEKKNLIVKTKIGILGDLMGSGKSLILIALCLIKKSVETRDIYYSSDKFVSIQKSMENYTCSKTNIFVIPTHLEIQWIDFFKICSSLNLKLYNKNIVKNNTKFIIDVDVDVVIVTSDVLNEFMTEFDKIMWNRIIIDEADSIKIQNNELVANFIWLVSGTPSGIATSKLKYIKNIFGKNINWITDVITVKNNNEYLKKSLKLPPINRIVIECETPTELKILKNFIPNSVIQLINAGNTKEAIKALNCCVDTKDNIFTVIKNGIENTIHNKMLEIETEKNKKITGLKLQESLDKIKYLEKSILNLKSRLKAIQEKIKNITEQICPVCMGDIDGDPVLLNCCGTTFCLTCLAFASKNKHDCMFCRSPIDKKSIHVVTKQNNMINKVMLKKKMNALLEIIEKSEGGVLIFANFQETFEKIKDELQINKIKYEILKGNDILKSLENFNMGKIKVLMLNATNFGAGLNLQSATDIVIYHRFTNEIEEQVIGRAQRIGRTDPLNVYYLIHENEKNNFSEVFDTSYIENNHDIINDVYN